MEEDLDLPQVKDWPDIEVKHITKVARGILERVVSVPHLELIECYPESP
jgi:hypothetical protein